MTQLSITTCSTDECPIGARWHRDWREYTLDLVKRPDRRRQPTLEGPTLATVAIDWRVGPGDSSLFPDGRTPPLTSASHRHAAFIVADHNVHVDVIHGSGSGPGFGLNAMLIHVDGEFRGSAWVYGCLGGGGNCFPVVARISEALAVVGDYPPMGYMGLPFVVVRQVTGVTTPNGGE
jgi:hypothetical protein